MLKLSDQQRADLRTHVSNLSWATPSYVIMNSLAAIIAGYGLLQNSTAVVIGAMIVATLLGPIIGIAYALVEGENRMLRRALLAEAIGIGLVLVLGFIVGVVHRDMEVGTEILSRTSPSIPDLVIALAGGAAGAYALISPSVASGAVGVAIATALVPPLTTAGICFARGDVRLAAGAFFLFLTNFVAIQVACSAVLWWTGFRGVLAHADGMTVWAKRNAVSASLLLVMTIGLAVNFRLSNERRRMEDTIRASLAESMNVLNGAKLDSVTVVRQGDQTSVYALVRCPYSIGPKFVSRFEYWLPEEWAPYNLLVETVLTKQVTRKGYLHELPPQPSNPAVDRQAPSSSSEIRP